MSEQSFPLAPATLGRLVMAVVRYSWAIFCSNKLFLLYNLDF